MKRYTITVNGVFHSSHRTACEAVETAAAIKKIGWRGHDPVITKNSNPEGHNQYTNKRGNTAAEKSALATEASRRAGVTPTTPGGRATGAASYVGYAAHYAREAEAQKTADIGGARSARQLHEGIADSHAAASDQHFGAMQAHLALAERARASGKKLKAALHDAAAAAHKVAMDVHFKESQEHNKRAADEEQ